MVQSRNEVRQLVRITKHLPIMKAPQIIMLAFLGISLLFAARGHGKERREKWWTETPGEVEKRNFWTSFVACCIWIAVLYWGGFFK